MAERGLEGSREKSGELELRLGLASVWSLLAGLRPKQSKECWPQIRTQEEFAGGVAPMAVRLGIWQSTVWYCSGAYCSILQRQHAEPTGRL